MEKPKRSRFVALAHELPIFASSEEALKAIEKRKAEIEAWIRDEHRKWADEEKQSHQNQASDDEVEQETKDS